MTPNKLKRPRRAGWHDLLIPMDDGTYTHWPVRTVWVRIPDTDVEVKLALAKTPHATRRSGYALTHYASGHRVGCDIAIGQTSREEIEAVLAVAIRQAGLTGEAVLERLREARAVNEMHRERTVRK